MFVVALFLSLYPIIHGCVYQLVVENNGPVTLDVPVNVTARVLGGVQQSFCYVFEDDIQNRVNASGNSSVTVTFLFRDKTGIRTIRVSVYRDDVLFMKGQTTVAVREFIPGVLNFSRTLEDKEGHKYLGTGWWTNISVQLQYPAQVLRDAEFAYSWTIGEDRVVSDHPTLAYTFHDPGQKWVRVAVVGRIPDYSGTKIFRYKWGYFNHQVTVKNTFQSLEISGNTYLEHGQLLNLQISCNGSGPVDYCWKLLPPTENHTNLSCKDPVTSAECSIPILYYFRDSGEYQLAVYVSNLVSSLQRNVQVHIYDVSLRPQLSTVIMPIVCTILVVVIIATGVIIQMRRHRSYSIETADFDFLRAESAAVAVETSWEHMWRSMLLQLRCCHSMNQPGPHYGTILKQSSHL